MKKDNLFLKQSFQTQPFTFNKEVAEVFDDMIHRSIPCYEELQFLLVSLSQQCYQPGSNIYDLGCSTGTTLAHLAEMIPAAKGQLIGVDACKEMINIATQKFKKLNSQLPTLITQDLNDYFEIKKASVLLLNLVLQFIKKDKQGPLLKNCYEGLLPGGTLFLVEKCTAEHDTQHPLLTHSYHQFKKEQGYSDIEIKAKNKALKTVLLAQKPSEIHTLLEQSGFSTIETFFKWGPFTGIMGIK